MKFITYQQYIDYLKNNLNHKVEEDKLTYKLEKMTNYETYDEKKIKEIDKKHDKMFRNILSRKTETVKFLNDFLQLREKIEESQIIQCHTDLITNRYEDRHSDIIYKLKEKPVYFLMEHQSTIDRNMPLRMWEYIGEIMRRESIIQKTYLRKEKIYPVVVPIIIYTGYQKWKLKTNFKKLQYQSYTYQDYQVDLNYNLIAVQDYSFDELLAKNTLLGSIMMIEKCKEKEELNLQLDRIIEKMKDIRDLEVMAEIITNIIVFRIGKEKAKEILEKIERKGELGMSPLTKMLLDLEYKNWKKGEKDGIIKGTKYTTRNTAKNMLKSDEPDEKVIRYTGITKEELEKLKLELLHS